MIKTQFFISFFLVTFTYEPPPKKKIFSSYPLKPNSHADNSLAAIPSEILTNPLPPPLPKNNIAYNISKLLIKFKKKKQKQTTNRLKRSILSSWQMVDASKPFFSPTKLGTNSSRFLWRHQNGMWKIRLSDWSICTTWHKFSILIG